MTDISRLQGIEEVEVGKLRYGVGEQRILTIEALRERVGRDPDGDGVATVAVAKYIDPGRLRELLAGQEAHEDAQRERSWLGRSWRELVLAVGRASRSGRG